MEGKVISPVAIIKNDFKEKFGIPRQSGRAKHILSEIVFLPKYRDSNALNELTGFSHVWLLFDFSLSKMEKFSPTVRPPRLGGNKRVGVFASRSPFRPNGIGLSCVKLVGIKNTPTDGDVLIVSGADLLDGTPIYDIKPYIPSADRIENAVGGYADEFTEYKLKVEFEEKALRVIDKDKLTPLTECLADDPRPSYQEDGKEYGMRFSDYEIKFTVNDGVLTVSEAKKV